MPVRTLTNPEAYAGEFLKIARGKLGAGAIEDVHIDDDIDLDGAICLRITFVLRTQSILRSKGDKLSEVSLSIKDFLGRQNDMRFPYVHYATKAEMKEIASQDA